MPRDSSLEARIRTRLAALESRDLIRRMRPPAGIDLSSNDYLRLATHPRVTSAFIAGVQHEGCGSTGSRLMRGNSLLFEEAEAAFARFKSAERALFLSSGYLANLAVLATLPEADDLIFVDERCHASLFDGCALSRARQVRVPHNDAGQLSELMAATPCDGLRFVVIESLYSMDGTIAPLAEYAAACADAGAVLIVDEAHAVGMFGERGSGLLEECGLDHAGCISINPAGKALGVGGAFVAGPSWAIEYLVQRARPFVFSTAAPPALAGALIAALDVIRDEPERRRRLHALASHARGLLRSSGVASVEPGPSPIIPVILGRNDTAVAVANAVQAEGFDVRAVRPPTVPRNTARLRVSINVGLSEDVLTRFAAVLTAAVEQHRHASPVR